MISREGVRAVVESFAGDIGTQRSQVRSDEAALRDKLRQAADWFMEQLRPGPDGKSKLRPEDVHLGQLWESFVNYGERLVPMGCVGDLSIGELYEATGASEFPKITGALIHSKLIGEYTINMGNFDALVDEVDSDKEEETIAGIITPDEPVHVPAQMPIPEGQLIEKYVKIKNYKFARSIALTREMVLFDKTGGEVLSRARDYGEAMARHRIRFILQKIQDVAVSATGEAAGTALNYKGSAYAIYQADHSTIDGQTNPNTITDAFGTDGLSSAYAKLSAMKDAWGNELNLIGRHIIVPNALYFKALQAVNSTGQFDSANRTVNPLTLTGVTYQVFTHPVLDANSTTAWYFGDFARNFRWQWVIRPRVEDMPGDPRRDILTEFKGIYYGGCGAEDYRYVVKSTGA